MAFYIHYGNDFGPDSFKSAIFIFHFDEEVAVLSIGDKDFTYFDTLRITGDTGAAVLLVVGFALACENLQTLRIFFEQIADAGQ